MNKKKTEPLKKKTKPLLKPIGVRLDEELNARIDRAIESRGFIAGSSKASTRKPTFIRWCIRHVLDDEKSIRMEDVGKLVKCISTNRPALVSALVDVSNTVKELKTIGRNIDGAYYSLNNYLRDSQMRNTINENDLRLLEQIKKVISGDVAKVKQMQDEQSKRADKLYLLIRGILDDENKVLKQIFV